MAFNVSHTQDPRLCHYDCQPDSIGVGLTTMVIPLIYVLTRSIGDVIECAGKQWNGACVPACVNIRLFFPR